MKHSFEYQCFHYSVCQFDNTPKQFLKLPLFYKFVVSVQGNKDPVFISKAIKRLHIMDMKKLISEIVQSDYGVDPRFVFECPECKHSETMSIPLDINFFSVS